MMEMARVMSQHSFDATIKFITVAGEEEDLYGSAHFAKVAKQQHMDVEGMLNNDIIGSDTGPNGQKMPFTIRLFSEGIPTVLTPAPSPICRTSVARATRRRASWPATCRRWLRTTRPTCRSSRSTGATAIYAAATRSRSCENGYPAVRFTEPIENFNHEHQTPRKVHGVQFGDLPQFMDFNFNDRSGAGQRADADEPRRCSGDAQEGRRSTPRSSPTAPP